MDFDMKDNNKIHKMQKSICDLGVEKVLRLQKHEIEIMNYHSRKNTMDKVKGLV